MRQSCKKNIDAADASADAAGTVVDARQLFAASLVAVSTGTSTGTLVIQASNDINPPLSSGGVPVPVNWVNITSQTVSITAACTVMLPKLDLCYSYIRCYFTKNNAAAGTITVYLNLQGV
jgi:hypothetical protein